MAEVARATGRLDVAEDSVQDACVVAVQQWAVGHVPHDPQAWLTGVARHKALDRLRRESRRPAKEATASEATASEATAREATGREATGPVGGAAGPARSADEDLWLIYLCCHPALSPEARIALTLRAVGGLTTAEIAAAFLVPEATMAKPDPGEEQDPRRWPGPDPAPGRTAADQDGRRAAGRVPHLQRGPPGVVGR